MAAKKAVPKVTRVSAMQKVERIEDLKPKVTPKPKAKKKAQKPSSKPVTVAAPEAVQVSPKEESASKGEAKLTIRFSKKKLVVSVLVIVVALAGFLAYREYSHTKDVANDPELAKQEEIKKTIKDVASHVQFNGVDKAVVSTVNDNELANLQKQDFFKEAQAGDKILVYAESKRVILFRPSLNKIVNMTQLSVTTGTEPKQ